VNEKFKNLYELIFSDSNLFEDISKSYAVQVKVLEELQNLFSTLPLNELNQEINKIQTRLEQIKDCTSTPYVISNLIELFAGVKTVNKQLFSFVASNKLNNIPDLQYIPKDILKDHIAPNLYKSYIEDLLKKYLNLYNSQLKFQDIIDNQLGNDYRNILYQVKIDKEIFEPKFQSEKDFLRPFDINPEDMLSSEYLLGKPSDLNND
jgi:hypothetical protein